VTVALRGRWREKQKKDVCFAWTTSTDACLTPPRGWKTTGRSRSPSIKSANTPTSKNRPQEIFEGMNPSRLARAIR